MDTATLKKGKKGKKGGNNRVPDEDFDAIIADQPQNPVKTGSQVEAADAEDDDAAVLDFGKKKKKNKGKGKGSSSKQIDDEDMENHENKPLESQAGDADEDDEGAALDFGKKKKKKKGKANAKQFEEEDEEISDLKPDVENEETDVVDFGKKKKKNKQKPKQEIDEDKQDSEVEEDVNILDFGKKKGTNFSAFNALEEDEEIDDATEVKEGTDDEPDEVNVLDFGKKKKKKKDTSKFQAFSNLDVDALEEDEDTQIDGDDVNAMDFGKKKKKKKDTSKFQAFSSLDVDTFEENEDIEGDGNEVSVQDFGKKKKKKKDTSKFQAFSSLDVEDNEEPEADRSELDNTGLMKTNDFAATAKKKSKKGKKGGRTQQEEEDLDAILAELEAPKSKSQHEAIKEEDHSDVEIPEENPDSKTGLEEPKSEELSAASKKKGKKGKKGVKAVQQDEDLDAILAELDGPKSVAPQPEVDVAVPPDDAGQSDSQKKKSKKGKKGGKSAQQDEDLDAILAELDGPKDATQPALESSEPKDLPGDGTNEVDGADTVESAAAKKKKKKKEREKAKAAGKQAEPADVEVPEEKQEASKGKAADKKVPKHVREMQERLARQKEAEERLRREEEERRRKEEEEQRRLEELERQKEEAKRRKKEKEKEKLLKKKQEGKLLTGKQKEEARRLALMREQLLAQKGLSETDALSKEDSAPRKPKYDNKKKRRPLVNETTTSTESLVEEGPQEHVEKEPIEEEPVVEKEPEVEAAVVTPEEESAAVEPEEEEDEDWDAKSWDDDKIELPPVKSAFAEDEDNSVKSQKNVAKPTVTQPPQYPSYASSVRGHTTAPAKPPQEVQKPSAPAVQKPVPQKPKSVNPPQSNGQESEEETESEDETESEEDDAESKKRRNAAQRRKARKAEALAKRSADDLRSPICCILGHVDTGKTKLLDCIRRTNVQEGEAGGITQQIGATYFPMENIKERTKELKTDEAVKIPGLLVIDTPGHESFTNLRSRGSGLCDIAILVVDIMHGLEPQTLESLNLLKMRHTPFVVALNKVDRLYDWKSTPNAPIRNSLKQQSKDVINEFERRTTQIITELKEQGLNSELYYKNKELRKVVSIVPTSAISGEGVPDILMLLVLLTQKVMEDKLMYISEVQCTVLEVKVVEGLGTTIDVILVNGVLHEGDQIVVCGMQGPIVTTIRALLTPHPMKELRVKGSYQHHKELRAAIGIKITAQGLEHAIAGTQLHVVGPDDDIEDIKEEAMQDMKNVFSRVDKSGEGVCVQASTLGSLEALLEFLKSPAVKIPVSGINIGPVHKRDVMRASVMLERKKKEYATILAFDVKVTPEAKELAEELGVRIFMADIIYHLFDQFTAYLKTIKEEKRKEVADEAVFPCVLSIKPQFVFNKKDPIILGVDVLEGVAKIGTPLCVPSQDMILIGRIASMEVNHKVVDVAKKGQAVAMKIVGSTPEETQKMFGRHFDHQDELVSHITRRSIDVLKESFRDELTVEEWKLVVKLKKLFNIP